MVKDELNKLNLSYTSLELGKVILEQPISTSVRNTLAKNLQKGGLELMEDKTDVLVATIKGIVLESILEKRILSNLLFSEALSKALAHEYIYRSEIFLKLMGLTLPKYIIEQKITLAKSYLIQDGLKLVEIAKILKYSSVGHLSRQFKEVTGFTPSYFKQHQLPN